MKHRRRARAAARGHDGHDPRDLAVGDRQPLRVARARARTTRRRSPTAARSRADDTQRAGRPRPALQHARPEDAHGPAEGDPGPGRPTTAGKAPRGAPSRCEYLSPALTTTSRLTERAGRRRRGLRALLVDTSTADGGDRRAPRRPGASWWATRTPRPRAIGDENVALVARAGPAAGHAAQGQHHVREPARDARRPGPAGGRVQAGHARTWRRSSRACARWSRDARPTVRDLRMLIRTPRQEQRPDRADGEAAAARAADLAPSSRARSGRSTARRSSSTRCASTRPTWPAGSPSSARAPRPTTPTATTRASSRSSARSASTTADRPADADARRASASTASSPPVRRCPGGAMQPPPDGSAPFVVDGLRSRRRATGPTDAAPAHSPRRWCVALPVLRRARRRRRRRRRRGYEVRAIFDNVAAAVPGRGREGRRGEGRRDRVDGRDRRQEGGGGAADRRRPLHALPRRRAVHGPAAVADRREVRGVRSRAPPSRPELARSTTATARASTCCRSSARARRWTST